MISVFQTMRAEATVVPFPINSCYPQKLFLSPLSQQLLLVQHCKDLHTGTPNSVIKVSPVLCVKCGGADICHLLLIHKDSASSEAISAK